MDRTVPATLAERLTGDPVVAHLATCTDGRPHAAPLWFRYVDPDEEETNEDEPAGRDVIEVMTTGRKLADVRENPRVALSIHAGAAGHPDWRATLRGTATVVEDPDETRAANRKINRRYRADDPDAWLEENTLVRIAVGSASYEEF
jgi:nitroimidazol reductase NimA-like FMN-containing flavoprotein (pyridoxamine 5'-phosphate oxidase superfamily)